MIQFGVKLLADNIKSGTAYLFAGRGCGKTELLRRLNAELGVANRSPHCETVRRYMDEGYSGK